LTAQIILPAKKRSRLTVYLECSIKITQIDPENLFGFTLKSQLENKSAEKTYMFSVESGAINGVECDPLFAVEIAAGKNQIMRLTF